MKNNQRFVIIALFFTSIFLFSCDGSTPKIVWTPPENEPVISGTDVAQQTNTSEEYQKYQQTKKEYEAAKKTYEAAQQNVDPVQKGDVIITSSERIAQSKKAVQQKTYNESSLLISIYADGTVNPDRYGRATPVDVHIFQLDEADSFDTLDYNTLVETDNPADIDRTFISKQIIGLFPDEKRKTFLELDNETHYLGVMATYNDISSTRWKAIISLQSVRNILYITLNEDGIQIAQ